MIYTLHVCPFHHYLANNTWFSRLSSGPSTQDSTTSIIIPLHNGQLRSLIAVNIEACTSTHVYNLICINDHHLRAKIWAQRLGNNETNTKWADPAVVPTVLPRLVQAGAIAFAVPNYSYSQVKLHMVPTLR